MRKLSFSPEMMAFHAKIDEHLVKLKEQSRSSAYWIYLIRDPLTGDRRDPTAGDPIYVGETNNPSRRAETHITLGGRASARGDDPLYRRLHSIIITRRVPIFDLVEEATNRLQSREAEYRWIRKLQSEGYKLFNKVGQPDFNKTPSTQTKSIDLPIAHLWNFTIKDAIYSGVELCIRCHKCKLQQDISLESILNVSGPYIKLRAVYNAVTCPSCNAKGCLKISKPTKIASL